MKLQIDNTSRELKDQIEKLALRVARLETPPKFKVKDMVNWDAGIKHGQIVEVDPNSYKSWNTQYRYKIWTGEKIETIYEDSLTITKH